MNLSNILLISFSFSHMGSPDPEAEQVESYDPVVIDDAAIRAASEISVPESDSGAFEPAIIELEKIMMPFLPEHLRSELKKLLEIASKLDSDGKTLPGSNYFRLVAQKTAIREKLKQNPAYQDACRQLLDNAPDLKAKIGRHIMVAQGPAVQNIDGVDRQLT